MFRPFDKYLLLCFSSTGYETLRTTYKSLTRAVNEGKTVRREGNAFSFHVYGVTINGGRERKTLIRTY